jgi:hypothetical protein
MLRAAVDGVVDYSQANLLDYWWHLRLNLLLNELVDREMLAYLRLSNQRHLAYLGVPGLTEESWKQHREGEHSSYEDYIKILLGVFQEDERSHKERLEQAMTEAWEREFGDTADPQTQVRIEAAAAQLRLHREQGG